MHQHKPAPTIAPIPANSFGNIYGKREERQANRQRTAREGEGENKTARVGESETVRERRGRKGEIGRRGWLRTKKKKKKNPERWRGRDSERATQEGEREREIVMGKCL